MSRASDILAAQEAKVSDLRKRADETARAIEREEAVLHGMRLMTQSEAGLGRLAPSISPELIKTFAANNSLPVPNRRGRQPGAISHHWRDILGRLYRESPEKFSVSDVIAAAVAYGRRVGNREVDDRMRVYLDLGYVERSENGFRVSELAAQKYGFRRRQTQEAPTAIAEGAS